jgi:hypothetical protein
MKKISLFITVVILLAAATSAKAQHKLDSTVRIVYTCTMHPEVISDKPGKCPKCGMELVQKKIKTAKQYYTCPMHSDVISDKPGKCPKCGMELVKKPAPASNEKMN